MHLLKTLGLVAALATVGGCYNPNIGFDLDAGVGFRCYVTDFKPCPEGLSCCDPATGLCDDALYQKSPLTRGWCTPPRAPADLTSRAIDLWDFGAKTLGSAAASDPGLFGKDPNTGEWRCPYTQVNRLEPNDTPADAINPGPSLNNVPAQGIAGEICPGEKSPAMTDVDVYKVRLMTRAKLYADTKFQANQGDLDVALFGDSGDGQPRLVANDGLKVEDNSCLAQDLDAGLYYVVVRGSPDKAGPYNQSGVNYALNRYTIRIAVMNNGAAGPCGSTVGDMR